jgi:hypothetical protein
LSIAGRTSNATADDFWETGASGRRHSREFAWATLRGTPREQRYGRLQAPAVATRVFQLREIAPLTYLLTYTLWAKATG